MSDIYRNQPLSELLQDLVMLVRRYIASGREIQLDCLAGLHAQLRDAHRLALGLEVRARDADQLEAVARDIEMASMPEAMARQAGYSAELIAHARSGEVGARAELVAQQRELQADLDAEDAAKVVRISRYRKPRIVCGGPDDGDAA